ncbi:MAG: two component transcriptional regulator, LuxR family [Bacteroidetes bacterium]|jgi:DNA-binding NarL/FixJ family response regulator|nr:two component transcriptional regulator, LuxR family [Bacteroidota bacterium]
MIKLLIADNCILIREGFKALLSDITNFEFVGEAENNTQLKEMNNLFKPDVLIIDCYSLLTGNSELKALKRSNKNLRILAITQLISKNEISSFLNGEVTSYLLKECDREEIIDAIHETQKGKRFLCGKIAHVLSSPEEIVPSPAYMKSVSCEGITVTEREADVIRYISEGLSNKQIADKLFLSTHTVNTHRKNIMNKLGVNNTAGIVMYAVKNNLLEPNTLLFAN